MKFRVILTLSGSLQDSSDGDKLSETLSQQALLDEKIKKFLAVRLRIVTVWSA